MRAYQIRSSSYLHQTMRLSPRARPLSLFLDDGLTPIMPSVVKKIQALEFVDFSELMPNNRELLRCMEATDKVQAGTLLSKSKMCQVWSTTTWAQCFMVYAAILPEAHPGMVTSLMAYGKLILREAARFSGTGWKVYNTMFKQTKKDMPWAVINQISLASQTPP